MRTIDYSIRLGFKTIDGSAVNMNIPRANPSVTGAQVRTAMQRILDTQIVATGAGTPATIDKAELIYTEETDYEI